MRNKWILLALLCLIFVAYTVDLAQLGLLVLALVVAMAVTFGTDFKRISR